MRAQTVVLSDDIVLERGVAMTTREGTVLVADIYFPAEGGQRRAGRFPVLLERTPYDRKDRRFADFAALAVPRGFAVMIQDVRGRNDSGGTFHMHSNIPDEGMDGADTMAWILAQDWCNGDIGTMGGSFSAANQQSLALNRPKGLRAQFLRDAGTNYWKRMQRTHGAFLMGGMIPWALDYARMGEEARRDPAVAARLDYMRDNVAEWIFDLPFRRGESPLALAPSYEHIYFTQLEEADFTEYWRNPTTYLEESWDRYPTDVAVLMVSGWYAHHAQANLDKLVEFSRRFSAPVRLIMGPWIHSPLMLETSFAGEADFGPQARAYGPLYKAQLDWLERFVIGRRNGAEEHAALRYFVMGLGDGHRTPEGRIYHGGEWRGSDVWPLPGTKLRALHLHGGGALSFEPVQGDAAPSRYDFNPKDPCPVIGSTNLQAENFPAFIRVGAQDQRCRPDLAACRGSSEPLAKRPDMLVFQTEPLAGDLEVTGSIELRLFVATSARDTDFSVRLSDVYPPSDDFPDGVSLLITDGFVRMRYRDGRHVGALVEPGQVYDVPIELGPTSNVFKKGHRIRLYVTSSAFPQFDVNPNTGEPLGRHTHRIVAHQHVHHDAARPSRLILPIQPILPGPQSGD